MTGDRADVVACLLPGYGGRVEFLENASLCGVARLFRPLAA
jgi:hypothetical protein